MKVDVKQHTQYVEDDTISCCGITHRPLLLLEPDAQREIEGIPQSEPHNSVVVGLSKSNFHYEMVLASLKCKIDKA